MARVHFLLPDGRTQTVEGPSYPETLMEIAHKANVPGIIGDCGGFMSCATCHCYVGADWLAKLPPPSHDETEILGMTTNARPESRLACQIWLTRDLDGIMLTPAPER